MNWVNAIHLHIGYVSLIRDFSYLLHVHGLLNAGLTGDRINLFYTDARTPLKTVGNQMEL